MKLADYLFSKFYRLVTWLGSTGVFSATKSCLFSVSMIGLNLLTVLNVAELVSKKRLLNIVTVLILIILYGCCMSAYYFRGDRYKQIISKYDEQSGSSKNPGSVLVIFYVIATLIAYYYFAGQRHRMTVSG